MMNIMIWDVSKRRGLETLAKLLIKWIYGRSIMIYLQIDGLYNYYWGGTTL